MGVVVARAAQRALEEQPKISGPDDLEDLQKNLHSTDWKPKSASFSPEDERLQTATLNGELDNSPALSRLRDSAELQSFTVKHPDGEPVRFTLKDGEVDIHQYSDYSTEPAIHHPDYLTIFLVGHAFLYAMYSVDQLIDRNGLRPVVDEVKERRWVILVTCAILAAY